MYKAERSHWYARKLRPVAEQGDDAWEVARCLERKYDKAWGGRAFGFLGCMDWVICVVRIMVSCEGEPMA